MTSVITSAARRSILILAGVPFTLAVIVLLLADRAPSESKSVLRFVWGLGARIQDRSGLELLHRPSSFPLSYDQVGHVTIWSVAAVLAMLLLAHRMRFRWIGLSVFGLSLLSEVGQRFLTSSRKMELADVSANLVGILFGMALGALILGTLSLGHRLLAGRRSLTG
jgi:hypothetical protein